MRVLFERAIHVLSRFQQRVSMAFRTSGIRFEQVVAHVRAGEIEVATDALEDLRPKQEVVANAVVRGLDLLKGGDAVDPREDHESEQTAEARDEDQAAV